MHVLRTLALTAVLACVAAPRAARADDLTSLGRTYAAVYFGSSGVPLGVAGVVFGLGNLANRGRDQPSLGWIIPGYIVGGLNVLLGVVIAAYGGLGLGNDFVGWGVGQLALGGLDITLASLAVAKRRRARYEPDSLAGFSLGPLVAQDGRRTGVVLGLGVRRAIW